VNGTSGLLVAYARPSGTGSLTGTGGYIDEFDTSGDLIATIDSDAAGYYLNGPWGMVIAPPGFGRFGDDLLVGNFGGASGTAPNGTITAINLTTHAVACTVTGAEGSAISDAGLWSLQSNIFLPPIIAAGLGSPKSNIVIWPVDRVPLSSNSLYISAGIDSQTQGLLAQVWFAPAASATVAALSPSAPQPTVSTTEDQVFFGEVASFTDTDPSATTSEFNDIMIYWGDGTPETAGTISQPGGPGTLFLVSGTHTYAAVNGGASHDTITVDVHDVNGLTATITNTAVVADVALIVAGYLNPASDSGASHTDNITDVVQPNFVGTTSQPFATFKLYAQAAGSASPVLIGQGASDATGAWNITAKQRLADGAYAITAVATDSSGQTASGTTTIVPNLVIDTAGPRVTGVAVEPRQGRIVVTFRDDGGPANRGVGLNPSSLIDASNYRLVIVRHPRAGKFQVDRITDSAGPTTGAQTVTLTINDGHAFRDRRLLFTIDSAGPTTPSGIRDLAGNALDGEFYGYFPSGNRVNGGDFVARLTVFHHIVDPPSTIVGRATPVSPPDTRQGKFVDPPTSHRSALYQARTSAGRSNAARRDPARVVHDSGAAVSHPIPQFGGPMLATPTTGSSADQVTAMGAFGALDHALDRVGTSKDKHRKS
jgi:hypothetical protein